MMKLPIRLVAVLLLWALVVPLAPATTSLSFLQDGYWIDMEIGHAESATVASIRVHVPGDCNGVHLPGNTFAVEVLDIDQRQLVLHYAGDLPALGPFVLTVEGDKARLDIDGRTVASTFRWFM